MHRLMLHVGQMELLKEWVQEKGILAFLSLIHLISAFRSSSPCSHHFLKKYDMA